MMTRYAVMSLEQEIKNWDGKSSSDIGAIYDRCGNDLNFTQDIIQFSGISVLQKGSTWLLKRYFEHGHKINDSQSKPGVKSAFDLN